MDEDGLSISEQWVKFVDFMEGVTSKKFLLSFISGTFLILTVINLLKIFFSTSDKATGSATFWLPVYLAGLLIFLIWIFVLARIEDGKVKAMSVQPIKGTVGISTISKSGYNFSPYLVTEKGLESIPTFDIYVSGIRHLHKKDLLCDRPIFKTLSYSVWINVQTEIGTVPIEVRFRISLKPEVALQPKELYEKYYTMDGAAKYASERIAERVNSREWSNADVESFLSFQEKMSPLSEIFPETFEFSLDGLDLVKTDLLHQVDAIKPVLVLK